MTDGARPQTGTGNKERVTETNLPPWCGGELSTSVRLPRAGGRGDLGGRYGENMGVCPEPAWPLSGELDYSHQDHRGQSGSPWVLAGADLQDRPEESALPTWLPSSTTGWPRGPGYALALWCLALLTASLHGNLSEGRHLEAGDPGAAQGPKVSWELPFHSRWSCFHHCTGLGTAPIHEFHALGL